MSNLRSQSSCQEILAAYEPVERWPEFPEKVPLGDLLSYLVPRLNISVNRRHL